MRCALWTRGLSADAPMAFRNTLEARRAGTELQPSPEGLGREGDPTSAVGAAHSQSNASFDSSHAFFATAARPFGPAGCQSQRRLEYQAVVARFAGDAFAVKVFQ
jgi:hypothetical protein